MCLIAWSTFKKLPTVTDLIIFASLAPLLHQGSVLISLILLDIGTLVFCQLTEHSVCYYSFSMIPILMYQLISRLMATAYYVRLCLVPPVLQIKSDCYLPMFVSYSDTLYVSIVHVSVVSLCARFEGRSWRRTTEYKDSPQKQPSVEWSTSCWSENEKWPAGRALWK